MSDLLDRLTDQARHTAGECMHLPRCTIDPQVALGVVTETEKLRSLLAELIDPNDCIYDHDSLCQAHNLDPRPCPHEQAKSMLGYVP